MERMIRVELQPNCYQTPRKRCAIRIGGVHFRAGVSAAAFAIVIGLAGCTGSADAPEGDELVEFLSCLRGAIRIAGQYCGRAYS